MNKYTIKLHTMYLTVMPIGATKSSNLLSVVSAKRKKERKTRLSSRIRRQCPAIECKQVAIIGEVNLCKGIQLV